MYNPWTSSLLWIRVQRKVFANRQNIVMTCPDPTSHYAPTGPTDPHGQRVSATEVDRGEWCPTKLCGGEGTQLSPRLWHLTAQVRPLRSAKGLTRVKGSSTLLCTIKYLYKYQIIERYVYSINMNLTINIKQILQNLMFRNNGGMASDKVPLRNLYC